MHPNMKAHLYKTYVRPALTYGCENMNINASSLNDIKRTEGNIEVSYNKLILVIEYHAYGLHHQKH
ncbi:hypothetical protein BpHYR1_026765 [Brachionus plicatilis]|uniref:RNA-directed DNA polymerase from mobile element jockey-like n=1 Tax=Brachionus plicatilis TaxID=10195 RepID=A0A3M7QXE1_BRAPC|nr:hypothetical protein BpHYR1_026765 [Brachionus plicatilis]